MAIFVFLWRGLISVGCLKASRLMIRCMSHVMVDVFTRRW